ERTILRPLWGTILSRMDHVEFRTEKECLTFRPVVCSGPPPASVAVTLTEEQDAIVEQVATERRKRSTHCPVVRAGRSAARAALPAATTKRTTHEEGSRVNVDRVFDDDRGIDVPLQQGRHLARIAEILMPEYIHVERVCAVGRPVSFQPVTKERELACLVSLGADKRRIRATRSRIEPYVSIFRDMSRESRKILAISRMKLDHLQTAAGFLSCFCSGQIMWTHLAPELDPR